MRRVVLLVVFMGFVLALSSCASSLIKQSQPVHHVVLLWFDQGISADEIENIRRGSLALAEIEQVRSVKVGEAIESGRPVVDDSFDLAVLFEFDSVSDMRAYEQDPRHQAFVARHIKGRMEKMVMYDF